MSKLDKLMAIICQLCSFHNFRNLNILQNITFYVPQEKDMVFRTTLGCVNDDCICMFG